MMPPHLLGLHHVTATVDRAQPDLDFCVGALGLRLVKKTVNFDNHHVFHFYYGTERGAPGTIWTTFPYSGYGVRVGVKGAGQVTETAFSVPAGSLHDWTRRLQARGYAAVPSSRWGDEVLTVIDPSGLVMTLVASDTDSREPWSGGGLSPEAAIRGLHNVSMTVRTLEPTLAFLVDVLGFAEIDRAGDRVRLAVNGQAPGRIVDVVRDASGPAAVNGLGTVHHVAWAIGTGEEQLALREDLVSRDLYVTDVRDRQYFTSIYFREPGGVLFEVATLAPGFTLDEPLDALGRDLKLPPWEEPFRAEIERGLPPVTHDGGAARV
jgi:glyoxalase family protein